MIEDADSWIIEKVFQKIVDFWSEILRFTYSSLVVLIFSCWIVSVFILFSVDGVDPMSVFIVGLVMVMLYDDVIDLIKQEHKTFKSAFLTNYRRPPWNVVRIANCLLLPYSFSSLSSFVSNIVFIVFLYVIACTPKPPKPKEAKITNVVPNPL